MIKKLKSIDYRHYICIALCAASVAAGFLFPNAIPRALEAVRDLATSIAYYFCELFLEDNFIPDTVNRLPEWQFAESRWQPLEIFPWTWEEFKELWPLYWDEFFSLRAFFGYLGKVMNLMYTASQLVLMLMPLFLIIWVLLRRYTDTYNNDYNVDSEQLKAAKRFMFRYVYPINHWVLDFKDFLKENGAYWKIFFALWGLHFNVIPILGGALAFWLYFVVTFDWKSIWRQLEKLMIDLAPAGRFLPVPVWITIGFLTLNWLCRWIAFSRLRHCERKNRGFINERGVVTTIYGEMGTGKTALVTSMGLSTEAEFRDMAFEILLECDVMFPNFPWCNLREEIKRKIDRHELVDVPSVRRWVGACREVFDAILEDPIQGARWVRKWRKKKRRDYTFGYDYEHFALVYNDELKLSELYSAIEDYACAYLIYTIETSLIISNYSVRVDAIKDDLGNFPLWDADFFRRDPRLMDAYSRHSHIIDFDMLRLGKRMVEENPNRNAFGYGVYLISEIDKERKNMLELKETKLTAEECNQRNDLFNACLKMSRHACVIANRVFLKIICDLQRPEDWGAGGREVGEVVYIADRGDKTTLLPFFSPFWVMEPLFNFIKAKWESFYVNYIYNRADNTLFVQLVKGIVSRLDNHYRRVNNLFGCQVLHLEVESGRMNGESRECKYYRLPKKDFSKRYSTNCLSAIFEGDAVNTVSIADFCEYAGIMATTEELAQQHSFFQEDLAKAKEQGESAPLPVLEQTALTEVLDCSLLTVYALMFGKNEKTPAEADEK